MRADTEAAMKRCVAHWPKAHLVHVFVNRDAQKRRQGSASNLSKPTIKVHIAEEHLASLQFYLLVLSGCILPWDLLNEAYDRPCYKPEFHWSCS